MNSVLKKVEKATALLILPDAARRNMRRLEEGEEYRASPRKGYERKRSTRMSALGSVPSAVNLKSADGLVAAMNGADKAVPYNQRGAAATDFFKKQGAALDTDVLIGAFSKSAPYQFRAAGEQEILKRELTAAQLKTIVGEGEFSRDTRVAAAERLVKDFSGAKEIQEAADPIISRVARAYNTDDIGAEARILRAMIPSKYVQERLERIAKGYGEDVTISGMCTAGYTLGHGISDGAKAICKRVLDTPFEYEQGMRLLVRGLVERHAKGDEHASELLLETAQRSPSVRARAQVVGHVGMQTGKPISTPEILKPELSRFDRTILDIGLRDKNSSVTGDALMVVEKNLGKGIESLMFALAKVTDRDIDDTTRVGLLRSVEKFAAGTPGHSYERAEVRNTATIALRDPALKEEAKRVLQSLQPA